MNIIALETISSSIPELWNEFIQKAELICQNKYKNYAEEKDEIKEEFVLEEILTNPNLVSNEHLQIVEAIDICNITDTFSESTILKDKILVAVEKVRSESDSNPEDIYQFINDIEFEISSKISSYNTYIDAINQATQVLGLINVVSKASLEVKFKTSLQKLKLNKAHIKSLIIRIYKIKSEVQIKIVAKNEKESIKIFEEQIDGCFNSFDQIINDQKNILKTLDTFQPFPLENMKTYIDQFKLMKDYLEIYPALREFIDSCKEINLNSDIIKKLENKSDQFFYNYDLFSEKSKKIFLDKMSNVSNKTNTFKQRFIDPISSGFDQESFLLVKILGELLFK